MKAIIVCRTEKRSKSFARLPNVNQGLVKWIFNHRDQFDQLKVCFAQMSLDVPIHTRRVALLIEEDVWIERTVVAATLLLLTSVLHCVVWLLVSLIVLQRRG
jgi:hypothetical protein